MLRRSVTFWILLLIIPSANAQNPQMDFDGCAKFNVTQSAPTNKAVTADARNATNDNYGVYATAYYGTNAYGLYARGYGASGENFAAWLHGRTKVSGLLDVSGWVLPTSTNAFGLGNSGLQWKYIYTEDNIVRGMRDFSSLDLVQAIKASTPPAAKPELSFHSRKHLNVAGGFQELDPASLPVRLEGGGTYYLVSREFSSDQYYDQYPLVGSDVMDALELTAPNDPVAGYFTWSASGLGSWTSGDSMKSYGPVNMKVE
ncbi:MAG TPA: hypothetical protein PLG73_10190 [Candidatus Sumerlaeota bacterium]|nr:hypothetical protein [Candidatus Sumerlaeota bacterium]